MEKPPDTDSGGFFMLHALYCGRCGDRYAVFVILSDRDIRDEIERGNITIDPYQPDAIQPASLEVHIDRDLVVRDSFMLGCTIETVTINDAFCAQVNGKSSLGRLGLLVHATAGFVDPGFSGQLTLELKNLSGRVIQLKQGQPVAQLVFHRLCCPAEKPYGHESLGSHYQGQVGPTRSHLEAEMPFSDLPLAAYLWS